MDLPADTHVHSEYSWDAATDPDSAGTMRRTCERASRIGLSTLIFTEHLDFEDCWRAGSDDIGAHAGQLIDETGHVRIPPFDLTGYLQSIDRCRREFPDLHILTGVEFGQPHLWHQAASDVLGSGAIDRVNGSLHMLPYDGTDRTEPITLYRSQEPADVMWAYLEEIPRMVAGPGGFDVLTHIDYAVRTWPTDTAGPFDPRPFEEGFRLAMRAVAQSERALEMNTRRLYPWIPRWWREEGGKYVSFGSDAHEPRTLAANFPEATAMLESLGFRAGSRPQDFWTRSAGVN